jgi:hypothetical protein
MHEQSWELAGFSQKARGTAASQSLSYSWNGSNRPRQLMGSDTSREDLYQASAHFNSNDCRHFSSTVTLLKSRYGFFTIKAKLRILRYEPGHFLDD